jgi:hypothetical protein
VFPFAPVIVWSPSHVTPETQTPVPTSQRSPPEQSVSAAQLVAQPMPLHTYGEHCFVSGTGQLPKPSQAAGSVAMPAVQLAATHVTEEPTNPVQAARVLPSHCAAEHGLVVEPVGQAGRFVPCGLPATGVHVPKLPCTSHASHWPVHALVQQTPSTQNPLTHAPFAPHAWPGSSVPWHCPPVQNAPAAQSLVAPHPEGQLSDVPEQLYGEHVGLPAYPEGAVEHVPSAVAPRAFEHTSHEPPHAASQQTPSVQCPVAHSRQLASRQSAPAAVLHDPPCGCCAWHVAPEPQ